MKFIKLSFEQFHNGTKMDFQSEVIDADSRSVTPGVGVMVDPGRVMAEALLTPEDAVMIAWMLLGQVRAASFLEPSKQP